jgi:hypothetical protein
MHYWRIPYSLLSHAQSNPGEKLVLAAIAIRMNNHEYAWPSWETISRDTNQSRATVHRAVRFWEKLGILVQRRDRQRRSCEYAIDWDRLTQMVGDVLPWHKSKNSPSFPNTVPKELSIGNTPVSGETVSTFNDPEIDILYAEFKKLAQKDTNAAVSFLTNAASSASAFNMDWHYPKKNFAKLLVSNDRVKVVKVVKILKETIKDLKRL